MTVLLAAESLHVRIGDTIVCDSLQLELRQGESWALLGRNGVGKSTLLLCLAGLFPPAQGRIQITGTATSALSPRQRAQRVAVLLQQSDAGFGASVRETVLNGRHPHHQSLLAWETIHDQAIAERCLHDVGMHALADRALTTLSGGELRRVEIARTLAQECPLTLFDEPLNHLDFAHQSSILRLLGKRCSDQGHAALMVLHDLNVAFRHCDHWLVLDGNGSWQAGPRTELADPELLSSAYAHPITRVDTASGTVFLTQ